MRRTNGASVGGGARNSICHVPRADRWSTLRIRSSMVYRQTTGSDRSTASAATLSFQASVSKNPRHYLGFPGKARSALPLLSPSEVDPPASARAERPPFDTFTATTRDATRNEDPPPPGLRPVWVKGGGRGLEQDRQPYPSKLTTATSNQSSLKCQKKRKWPALFGKG